jgi:integrase
VGHIQRILAAILNEAVRDGLLERNPAAGTWREYRLTGGRGPARHLTGEQLRALEGAVATSGPPWTVLIGLTWRTGLRRGEALALRWNDVELCTPQTLSNSGGWIAVHDTLYPDGSLAGHTKTRQARAVDLSPAAVDLLTRHRAWSREAALRAGLGHSPEWLFWGPAGKPILPAVLNARFRRWRRWAGLPGHLVVHSLRHTYAVRALEAGARERYVQDQLGHSSIQITSDLYGAGARLNDSKCLELMEMGKL